MRRYGLRGGVLRRRRGLRFRWQLDGWNGLFLVPVVFEAGCVRIWGGRPAHPRREDKLRRFFACGLDEDHIAVRPIEETAKNFAGGAGTVLAKDPFFVYSASDFDSCEAGDLPQDLIEAGVGSRDDEFVVDVRDVCPSGGELPRRRRRCRCNAGR